MGWNTYYGLGGDRTEAEVKAIADTMVRTGLRDAGYRTVWFDGNWSPPRSPKSFKPSDACPSRDRRCPDHVFMILVDGQAPEVVRSGLRWSRRLSPSRWLNASRPLAKPARV